MFILFVFFLSCKKEKVFEHAICVSVCDIYILKIWIKAAFAKQKK